jgi:hypothetical protein
MGERLIWFGNLFVKMIQGPYLGKAPHPSPRNTRRKFVSLYSNHLFAFWLTGHTQLRAILIQTFFYTHSNIFIVIIYKRVCGEKWSNFFVFFQLHENKVTKIKSPIGGGGEGMDHMQVWLMNERRARHLIRIMTQLAEKPDQHFSIYYFWRRQKCTRALWAGGGGGGGKYLPI